MLLLLRELPKIIISESLIAGNDVACVTELAI